MMDYIEDNFCVDLDSVHALGCSSGGIMAYDLAKKMPERLASIAPQVGSVFMGYNYAPPQGVSVMDTHGFSDRIVPANISNGYQPDNYVGPHDSAVSSDGFFYTQVPDILDVWGTAFRCSGGNAAYVTGFEHIDGFRCNKPLGDCPNGIDVVQCTGDWGHTWALCKRYPCATLDFAEMTLNFFESHTKQGYQISE